MVFYCCQKVCHAQPWRERVKRELEAAQKEAAKKAEEARRVETARRETKEKNSWSSPLSTSSARRDNKHWPRERPLQLIPRDPVPVTKDDYK